MANSIRYKPNHRGVAALLVSPEMMSLATRGAEEGMQYAISISPHATGEYAGSFRVESGKVVKAGGNQRACAELHNDSDHALEVEFTNGDRVLGRTVDFIEKLKF